MNALLLCAALVLPAAAQPTVGPAGGLAEFENALRDIAAGARAKAEELRSSIAGRETPAAPAPVPAPTAELVDLVAYFDRMPGIVGAGGPADPRQLHITVRVTNPTDLPLTYRVEEAALTTLPVGKGAAVLLNETDGSPSVGVDRTLAAGGTATFQMRGSFGRARAGDRLRATVTMRLGSETVTLRAAVVVSEVL
jgi:hypothetical protein